MTKSCYTLPWIPCRYPCSFPPLSPPSIMFLIIFAATFALLPPELLPFTPLFPAPPSSTQTIELHDKVLTNFILPPLLLPLALSHHYHILPLIDLPPSPEATLMLFHFTLIPLQLPCSLFSSYPGEMKTMITWFYTANHVVTWLNHVQP